MKIKQDYETRKQDYETRKQDYGTMTNKTMNNKRGAKPDLAKCGMKHGRKGEDFAKTMTEPGSYILWGGDQ